MKKAVVKIPAKVNLTLDVIEKKRSYQPILSLGGGGGDIKGDK